jgi:hypothetical protein
MFTHFPYFFYPVLPQTGRNLSMVHGSPGSPIIGRAVPPAVCVIIVNIIIGKDVERDPYCHIDPETLKINHFWRRFHHHRGWFNIYRGRRLGRGAVPEMNIEIHAHLGPGCHGQANKT